MRRARARARGSSTSRTTATSSRSASTTGSSSSWSSGRAARSSCGRSRSSRCACRSSSTCARIRSSGRTSTSNTYWDWYISKAYLIMAAQAIVTDFLATFRDFPPRQKAASFTIDQALERMEARRERRARLMAGLASWNDTATREAIVVVRRDGGADRAAGGARRGLRQRRHAVVREADAGRARLHPRAARRDGRGRRVAPRASSRGRPRTRRTTPGSAASIDEALRRRRQRREGADGRASCRRSRVRRSTSTHGGRARSSAAPSTPRSVGAFATARYVPMVELLRYLEAHGFACFIASGGESRLHARGHRRDLRDPARARDRKLERSRATSTTSTAARSPTSPSRTSSTTAPSSRSGSGAGSGAGRSSPAGTRTATSRCSASRAARAGRPCGCSSSTTIAEREFDYVRGAEKALERARDRGLDGGQHQGRLDDRLRGHVAGRCDAPAAPGACDDKSQALGRLARARRREGQRGRTPFVTKSYERLSPASSSPTRRFGATMR